MKKRMLTILAAALVLALLAAGCGRKAPVETMPPVETTEATEPAPTAPADGNPSDVTCKGTYTAEGSELTGAADKVVAQVGEEKLTVRQLQLYYWLEVAQFRLTGGEGPDFSQGLDTQLCDIDDTAITWQQYFLQRALDTWHAHQALVIQSREGIPTEEAYQPNAENHAKYMPDQPATKVLYGYDEGFEPNTIHQAYLDGIGAMLEELAAQKGLAGVDALAEDIAGELADAETLAWYTELSNRGYMYFTELHYYVDPTEEAVNSWYAQHEQEYAAAGITKDGGKSVNVRHVLVVPGTEEVSQWAAPDPELATLSIDADGKVTCSDALWQKTQTRAEKLLKRWLNDFRCNEYTFADMAYQESSDIGSSKNGGLYSGIRQGQLTPVLDAWCFDEARQSGDTAIIRSDWGIHILYFSGINEDWYVAAEADWIADQDAALIRKAKEANPMKVDYSVIRLGLADSAAGVSASAHLLYQDIAHQRYPEVPLYLQQDYPNTMYGYFKITTHGCGITTMAMLASYMADDELTPPMMCEEYADYSYSTGTDGRLFEQAPPEMNFYLKKKTFDCNEARQAMEDGYLVISLQHKGYWTRGGHYLVLETMHEDGMVQVRDSNIFNYGKLQRHKEDSFPWNTITPNGVCFWIFDNKRTNIAVCARCGDDTTEGIPVGLLTQDYYCEKCNMSMGRRNNYINLCAK